jgi:hypothetical protein
MAFIEYLKTKKNIILAFYVFHLFALFVNVFHIEGNYKTYPRGKDKEPTYNTFLTRESIVIYVNEKHGIVTTESYSGHIESFNKQRFWPFVPFCARGILNKEEYYHNEFYGIFIFYDYSEFIAYSFILFLILYYNWNRKQSK